MVKFYNKFGNTHLIIDVFGYFSDASACTSSVTAQSTTEGSDIALHAFAR